MPLGYEQRDALIQGGYSASDVASWETKRRQALTDGGFTDAEVGRYFGDPTPMDGTSVANHVTANMESLNATDKAKVAQGDVNPFMAGWNGGLMGYAISRGKSTAVMPANANWWEVAQQVFGQFLGDAPVAIPAFITGALGGAVGGGAAGSAVPVVGTVAGAVVGAGAGGGAAAGAATGAMRQVLKDWLAPDLANEPHDALSIAGRIVTSAAKEGAVGAVGGAVGGAAGAKVTSLVGSKIVGELANVVAFSETSTVAGAGINGRLPTREDFVAGTVMALGGGVVLAGAHGISYTPQGMQVRTNLENIYVRTGLNPRAAVEKAAGDPALKQEILSPATEDGTLRTPGLDAIAPDDPPRFTDPKTVNPVKIEPSSKTTITIDGEEFHYVDGKLQTTPPPPPVEGAAAKEPVKPSLEQVAEALPKDVLETFRAVDEAVSGKPDFLIDAKTMRQYGLDPSRVDVYPTAEAARTIIANNLRIFGGDIRDSMVGYKMGDDFARGWIKDGRKFDKLPIEVQKYLQTAEAMGAIKDTGYNEFQIDRVLKLTGDAGKDIPPHAKPLEGELIIPDKGGKGGGGGKEPPIDATDITPPAPGPKKLPPGFELSEDVLTSKVLDIVAPTRAKAWPSWVTDPRKMWAGFEGQLKPARTIDRALGITKGDALNVEDMFRQTYASKDRAAYTVKNGPIKWNEKTGEIEQISGASWYEGYKAVKEDGGTLEGFMAWRIAARKVEKSEQGIDIAPGLDLTEAKRLVSLGEKKYARGEKIIQENKAADIDYARDAEVFSPERADAIKDLNKHHIVFRRVMDPSYVPAAPYGRGFRVKSPTEKIGTSERQIANPLQTEFDNKVTIIAMADRNRAILDFLDKLTRNVANPDQLRLAEPGKVGQRMIDSKILEGELLDKNGDPLVRKTRDVSWDEIIKDVGTIKDENGVPLSKEALDAMAPLLAERVIGRGLKDNQFLVFRNGKPEVWEALDADLAQLMKVKWPKQDNPVAEFMGIFARGARLGVVGEPVFALRTMTYGQIVAAAEAPHGGIPFHDIVLGVIDRFKGGEKFKEWERNGGAGAAMADIEQQYVERQIWRLWDETGSSANVSNVLTRFVKDKGHVELHPIEAIWKLQHNLDALARTGYMMRAEKAGLTPLKAATEARRAYIDYAERPQAEWVHTFTKLTPFMLSGIKDIGLMLRSAREHPVATSIKLGAFFVAPTVLNYAINMAADQYLPEQERYANIPQVYRDLYWISPPINGVRYKIRKPWVPGAIATITERFMQATSGDPEFAKGIMGSLQSQIVPPWQPAVMVPMYENWFNYNQVSGRPLVPASMESLSGYMQYYPDTTDTAKTLARIIGKPNLDIVDASPIVIENYLRQWGGTIPMSLLKMFEGHKEGKPAQEWADVPFVGVFFLRNPGAGQMLNRFYEGYNELTTAHADFKKAVERQDPMEIADTTKREAFVRLTSVATAIGKQQKLIELVNGSDMTDDEKRKYVDALNTRIFTAAKYGTQVLGALD